MMAAVAAVERNATRGKPTAVNTRNHLKKSPALHRAFFISEELEMKSNPPVLLDYALV